MPTLYLVPTPLGDPDDITLRALRILREVSAIATDNPAATQALLDHHLITTTIMPQGELITKITADLALVTASGTPGMDGSAHDLVVEAIRRGIRIEPLPGANAAITALVLSGLPTDSFAYFDPLPDDLDRLASDRDTLVFRSNDAVSALEHLHFVFGDRRVAVSQNLTQPNEVVYRGAISATLEHFRAEAIRGDALIVVAGSPPQIAETWDETRVRAELRRRLSEGQPLKQAAKAIAAEAGWDRRTVYSLGVEEKQR